MPEVELLRDVIFLLQGINGRHVGFEKVKQAQAGNANGAAAADTMLKIVFVEDGQVSRRFPERERERKGKRLTQLMQCDGHSASFRNLHDT